MSSIANIEKYDHLNFQIVKALREGYNYDKCWNKYVNVSSFYETQETINV